MGKEIVYCQGCGKSLREEEFARGKAQIVDNRPYCVACRPLKTPAAASPGAPPAAKKASSGRLLRVPTPPSTRRVPTQPRPKDSRLPLLVGVGLAALALVVLVILLAPGGKTSSTAASPPPQAKGEPQDPLTPTLQDLEKFASTAPSPEAVLVRCDQLRSTFRGTRLEERFRQVEDRARQAKAKREQPGRLDVFLTDIRKIIQEDTSCGRRIEVFDMLSSAQKIAGARTAEVEKLRADYEKKCQEADRR